MGKRDCEIVKPMPRGMGIYLLAKDVLIMFLREGGWLVFFGRPLSSW